MPATDAPYRAADAVEDARRLLRQAEQHAPFSAEAAGALRDVADGYTRLAAVLARPEHAVGAHEDCAACGTGTTDSHGDHVQVDRLAMVEWQRAAWEEEAKRHLGNADYWRQRAETAKVKAKAMLFRAECAEAADLENAARADVAERKLAETREEMFRLGGLLAKQCDRIDVAEAAGYPMLGNRYLDRNGEEWTVGTNGLMHHHSYSQRSFDEVRREYGPLKRNDMPAMVRADGTET